MSDLRKLFWNSILEIARKDKDVILLTGDLGYSFCEDFQKELPEQFINCGCAEQNMVGVAAGLARAGKKPYVYSNSIFILMRAYEQVRDDLVFQQLPVKIIGTGASGFLGFTHNLAPYEHEYKLFDTDKLKMFFPKSDFELKSSLLYKGLCFIKL